MKTVSNNQNYNSEIHFEAMNLPLRTASAVSQAHILAEATANTAFLLALAEQGLSPTQDWTRLTESQRSSRLVLPALQLQLLGVHTTTARFF